MIEMHFIELNKREHIDQSSGLWMWMEFLKAPDSKNLEWMFGEGIECYERIENIEDIKAIGEAKAIFV